MVIRTQSRAWWVAAAFVVPFLVAASRAAADPLTDSFLGGKPSTHTIKKKPTPKPAAKPAVAPRKKPAARAKSRPPKAASPGAVDDFTSEAEGSPVKAKPAPTRRQDAPAERAGPARSQQTAHPNDDSADNEDEDDARARRKRIAPTRAKARTSKRGDDDSEEDSRGADETARNDSDDSGESDAVFTSLPVVIPRVFSFQAGGTLMGRSFRFNSPLQQESSFPRAGYLAGLELYPLLLLSEGWYRSFGLVASYESEVLGQASVAQTNGSSSNTPVKQARWVIETRYLLPVGERLALAPAVGLEGSSFTLSTSAPIMASACTTTQTAACLPNTESLYFSLGLHMRVAATSSLGLSLDGAYLLSLSIKNRPANEIGYEARTSAGGIAVEVGATYMLTDWLAVRVGAPIRRYTYAFHTPPASPYQSATETYYGANASVLLFTK